VNVDWVHGPDRLREALNANLPADLVVAGIELAGERFHPRFDATSRCYRYNVYCQPIRDPLRDRTAWRIWPPVEGTALSRAAQVFLGQHDFGAFGSAPRKGGATERTVTISSWAGADKDWQFDVAADGFLYRMVRRIVFVQVAVAHARCPEEAALAALTTGRRSAELPAGLAPACGLTLVGVDY
jgi:tRNA pseudouridine38-40 synthase